MAFFVIDWDREIGSGQKVGKRRTRSPYSSIVTLLQAAADGNLSLPWELTLFPVLDIQLAKLHYRHFEKVF
jgi:hypothetical protein